MWDSNLFYFFLIFKNLILLQGLVPCSAPDKKVGKEIKEIAKRINDLCGIKESDTGLALPSQWDLVADKQMMQEEQPLQVGFSEHLFLYLTV